jgi:PAS domain S-box-containing protein
LLYHPEDRPIALNYIEEAAQGNPVEGEYRIITKGGEVRWLHHRRQPVWDSEQKRVVRVYGVAQDITERKLAGEKLRKSEYLLREAQQLAHVGSWELDLKTERRVWSDELYRIYGLDPQADLPTTEALDTMVHPDDLDATLEHRRETLETEVDTPFTFRIIRPEGTVRWLHTVGTVYCDEAGVPIRRVGTVQDITERVKAEQQRMELTLEKERSDTLEMLIGNISHDIKTPLAIINTSLYLLERFTDPQKRQEKIDNIKSQVHNLENFIQDLLALSRLDGNPILQLTPVNVNELVIDIEAESKPVAEKKQITFTLDLAEDMISIQADQADLRRAITNLVENALNYTPTGHTVTVRTAKQVDKALLEVVDTGIGIDDDDLPHIFDRFYRSTQAQTIISSGSGLGLAIVHRVIKMHGGSIDVTSQPGTGTTFCIQLPLQ